MKTITVEAMTVLLDEVTAFVDEQLETGGCPYAVQMQLDIVTDEIFTNIARYAYENGGNVDISCGVADSVATIIFSDSGKPYNPLKKADPDITLSAEEREIGGLGIFMVKKIADFVEYEYYEGRNILTIIKKFKS